MQGYITQVAKRSGNPFMIEKNVPPHLTISAFETRSEDQVISLFEETRDMFQSGEIIWCSVGAFFPNVLYLSPVLNTYLQELSGVFSSRVVRIGFAKTNPYEELWNFEL